MKESLFSEEELASLAARAHGFVAAQLAQPFASTEIKIVSQDELAAALMDMILEVRELTGKDEGTASWAKELTSWGEGKFASSFTRVLSKRVLGLYTQSYIHNTPGSLLLVEQNIKHVAQELGLDEKEFFLWVLIHETMHIAQFNTPGSYFKEEIKDKLLRIGGRGANSKQLIKEATTLMTWIEGSADAIMDEPGLLDKETIKTMRQKTEARRDRFSWSNFLLQILTRKNRQYREGRRFVKEVSQKYGMEPMGLIIRDRTWLPTEEEIKAPSLWIQRFEKAFS